MEDTLIAVSRSYNDIMPPGKEALLLLILLYKRIESEELEEEFSNRDFEEAIEDIAILLQLDKSIQKETLSKKLSGYFYHTISRNNNFYLRLTVYAKDFCKLIINRISPEVIKDLELAHVFRRTLQLTDADFENIASLSHWYANHFLIGNRQIIAHTEILNTNVENSIQNLKSLLKPDLSDLRELIRDFETIFSELSVQAVGLTGTMNAKDEILSKVKSFKERFSFNGDEFEQYLRIQDGVVQFFEEITNRINSINEKIQIASKRLSNLLDTLKHKQLYKVKLERFLHEMLMIIDPLHEAAIPVDFPRVVYPSFNNRFISIPFNDYKGRKKLLPDLPEIDDDHFLAEKERNYQMLLIQERTALWIDQIKKEITNGSEIVMEDWIEQIIEQENNLEIPISVCYGLLQSISHQHKLSIENQITKLRNSNLQLWKMRISPTIF